MHNNPSTPSIWPAVLCGLAGAAVFNLAPLYLAASAQRFSLGDQEVGWLMSAELAGIALASVLMRLLKGRLPARSVITAGATVLAAGNLGALQAESFDVFLAIRLLIGFLGDGLLYVSAVMLLGHRADPVRALATLSFTNMCFTAVMLLLLPRLQVQIDLSSLAWLFAGLGLAVLAASSRVGRYASAAAPVADAPSVSGRWIALLGLAGLLLYALNLGGTWSYAERLGESIGLATAQSAMLLGISILFQALGSLLALLLGTRIAPGHALSAVLLAQCAAAVVLAQANDAYAYLAGYALWGASWNFGAAHLLGVLARLPNGSRTLSLAPGVEALGVTLAPLTVALLAGTWALDLQTVLPALLVVSLVLTLACYRPALRRSSASQP